MKRFMMTSAMALVLGTAGAAFAQSQDANQPPAEQPAATTGEAGGAKACAAGDASCKDASGAAAEVPKANDKDSVAGAKADRKPAESEAAQQGTSDPAKPAQKQASDPAAKPAETQASDPAAKPAENQASDPAAKPAETQATEKTKPAEETTGAISNVTVEQKTEIKQIITETKVQPADIDIDMSVGVVVPRTVEIHPLPPRIIRIVPAYEHYSYFLLPDGRIVIVEPDTLKVVYILV